MTAVFSGAGGAGTGSTAGNPSANCPPWPLSKLFPLVGPFFYGPDPGPCTSNNGSLTYSYAAARVQSVTDSMGKQSETYTWQADRLSGSSNASSEDSYSYGPGSVVIVSGTGGGSGATQTYRLNAAGYPLDVSIENGAAVQRWLKYNYVDCLLDRRIETDASGNELKSLQGGVLTYTYDAKGHVGSRGAEQYDYGCWQIPPGGAGGSSGTGDPGAGGGAPDSTAGCPAWPTNKLSPFLGSLFYGPDPGPCTWTDGSVVRTFDYSGGVLKNIKHSDGGSETLTWDGERLVSSTETSAAGVSLSTRYSYSADSLTLTTINARYTSTATYRLSPTGYPLTRESMSVVTETGASSPVATTTYRYDNCRLSGSMYSFDASGHLIGVFAMNANRMIPYAGGTLDYSCWKH